MSVQHSGTIIQAVGDHYAAIRDGAVIAIVQRESGTSEQWGMYSMLSEPSLNYYPLHLALIAAMNHGIHGIEEKNQ